jgi:hypothetical protein
VDDLEAPRERLENLARAEEDGLDLVGCGRQSARDDLLGSPIAAHGVDGDPDGSRDH